MGTTIHFSEKHMQRLMKGFEHRSLTDGLFNHDIDQEFSGVRTVHVKSIQTSPLQNYDRNKQVGTGSRYGETHEVGDDEQTFTMAKDVSLSLSIDKGNNVEQFNMKRAGEVMNAYRDEVIIPAVDKHRMEKWAEGAGIHMELTGEMTKANIAETIIKLHNIQRNARVTGRSVLIVPYENLHILSLADEWIKTESLAKETLTKGTVGRFDDMDVVPFINELMPANAKFMILNPKAAIAPMKIKDFKGHVDPPTLSGDLLEFRMMFDAFVLGKKANGILVACTSGKVCATPKIAVSGKSATITCDTSDATIYYTTNGSDPRYSVDAQPYSAAVSLVSGDQLRAYAAKSGMYNSGVAEKDMA